MKICTIIVLCFLPSFGIAQNWQAIDGGLSYPVRSLYFDSISGYLYAGGESWQAVNLPNYHSIARWDGTEWSSLGSGTDNSPVLAIIRYHDTIWVGGSFDVAGGLYSPYLAKWNGSQWIASNYNFNGTVGKLRILNSNLYAVGAFDSVQGKASNGVAMFDGVEWNPVGNPKRYGFTVVADIAIYNDEIYICGLITDSLGSIQRILKYDGNKWDTVGSGFHGSFCVIGSLSVYKNELYAAGLFTIADGNNPGNYIAKWNGSSWSDVGGGVYGYNFYGNGQIEDIFLLNNDLYVGGVFQYANNIPALYVAKWDGSKWCSLGDTTMDNKVTALGAMNDTLIIGGGFLTINTDSVFFIAKYLGGESVDTCTSVVGISEIHQNNFDFSVSPNPATNEFVVSTSENGLLTITNEVGQMILSYAVHERELKNATSKFPSGNYFLTFQTAKNIQTKKLLIQH